MHHHQGGNQPFLPPSATSSSSTSAPANNVTSLAGNRKRMSKMESFPYEEYGMPESERESIKTRVSDLKTYDHFLHLTPIDSDLLRGDSIPEDEMERGSSGSGSRPDEHDSQLGRFENRDTLPFPSAKNGLGRQAQPEN
jgi:hypothetical protein